MKLPHQKKLMLCLLLGLACLPAILAEEKPQFNGTNPCIIDNGQLASSEMIPLFIDAVVEQAKLLADLILLTAWPLMFPSVYVECTTTNAYTIFNELLPNKKNGDLPVLHCTARPALATDKDATMHIVSLFEYRYTTVRHRPTTATHISSDLADSLFSVVSKILAAARLMYGNTISLAYSPLGNLLPGATGKHTSAELNKLARRNNPGECALRVERALCNGIVEQDTKLSIERVIFASAQCHSPNLPPDDPKAKTNASSSTTFTARGRQARY